MKYYKWKEDNLRNAEYYKVYPNNSWKWTHLSKLNPVWRDPYGKYDIPWSEYIKNHPFKHEIEEISEQEAFIEIL